MAVLLLRRLENLATATETNHPQLNWGGCCCFAAAVAARLRNIVPTRILVGNDKYDPPPPIDVVRKCVKNNTVHEWNKRGFRFAHVIVEFVWKGTTYHYDSTGVHPARKKTNMGGYLIGEGELTQDEANELAAGRGWNTAFPRRELPTIYSRITVCFNRIDLALAKEK
jgi:hypothetical protein